MSSLVVLCLSSHYRFVLLPHYELVPPWASVGYIQTTSSDVAQASPQLVPPLVIVRFVLSKNSLSFSSSPSPESVCDACQQAKSHQLPYPISTSTSKAPLELIFSDVWGPAYDSIGRYKYYGSFIDDFSKFT
jgi:hypothetical protein